MGWFGKKREAPDANEMLRRYNAAEAARLSDLTEGTRSTAAGPITVSASGGSGEIGVEDVFTITGRGLVATGKVSAGSIRVGDAVVVVRDGVTTAETEITGIEMFRTRASEAAAGDMVGVLLRGRIDIARGDVIRVAASA